MENPMTEFFPFGTQYHRAPTPLESEWATDMAEIAAKGYTHIQVRPQWRCHERIKGEYDFSELIRLLDEAQRNNLRVIVKPQLENAPDWVFTELGGTRIGFNGQPLPPIAHAAFYVGGWWPCFDNPAVAERASVFTENLARSVKDHPALWFFNAWNEPRSRPLGQCQCPHSRQSYRDYLKKRFGTIEALNSAYGKAWTSFETVFPPHSHSDYVEMFLWRQWAGEAVAQQVEISASAIRRGAPGKFVMCHVGQSSYNQDPACDTSNDLLNSAKVDWYGCSFPIEILPKNDIEYHQPLAQSAWLRRVDGNYWCQEFYTNYASYHREADPEYIEQAIWMALASGCRGLTFWQYRSERFGEESNGWGMRNMDGSPTPRSERCDRIAGELKKWGADFAKTNPVPRKIAVMFDIANDLLMRIQAMSGPLAGVAAIPENCNYSYKQSVRGAVFHLRKAGHSVDFVTPGQDLSGYDLVVAGTWEMVPENAVASLKKYVADGGTLLIEYPFACRDEKTWCALKRPASQLDELTGCFEAHRISLPRTAGGLGSELPGNCVIPNNPETRGELAGFSYDDGSVDLATYCKVELTPTTGSVLAHWKNGTAAVVRNSYGKGTVFTCGGNTAIATAEHGFFTGLPVLYKKALECAGLKVDTSDVWSVERASGEHLYRFLFQMGKEPFSMEVPAGFEVVYTSAGANSDGKNIQFAPHATVVLQRKN